MEFPKLGTHCFAKDCRKLDFLPMKCDACSNIFCRDHIMYEKHVCEAMHKKDKVVPSCPLCGKVIPILHGEDVNAVVNRHIDSDCQSDPAKERRNIVYVNSCSQTGCKKREAIPFTCIKCNRNFCLKHRLETDHECKKVPPPAAKSQPAPKNIYNDVIPNGMSEDEALARALQMSLESAPSSARQVPQQTNARSAASARNPSQNPRSSNNRRNEDVCTMS